MKDRIFLAGFYMLFVLMVSLMPMESRDYQFGFLIDLEPNIQNFLHVPVYAILAIALLRVTENCVFMKWKKNLIVLFICIGFGVINEILQVFIPGRYGGLLDAGFNALGSFLGIVIYLALKNHVL